MVTVMEEWPRWSCTALGLASAAASRLAQVCFSGPGLGQVFEVLVGECSDFRGFHGGPFVAQLSVERIDDYLIPRSRP